jgi:hypothetical protein
MTKHENNSSNGWTWFSPSPSLPTQNHSIAGKPIVHRLVRILQILKEPIDEVAFILGDPAFEMSKSWCLNW